MIGNNSARERQSTGTEKPWSARHISRVAKRQSGDLGQGGRELIWKVIHTVAGRERKCPLGLPQIPHVRGRTVEGIEGGKRVLAF